MNIYGFPLIGFSLSGKDSLIKDLQSKRLSLSSENTASDCKWEVYAAEDNKSEDLKYLLDPENAAKIRGFSNAKALKEDTHAFLQFQNCQFDTFENVKDSLLCRDPFEPMIYKILRQWYIEKGKEGRDKDPLIWARKRNEKIEKTQLIEDIIPIDSDTRYENELMDRSLLRADGNSFFLRKEDLSTIRLYRASVQEKPLHVDSEHSLDSFLTKYLFVAPGNGELAKKRFPQYEHFYHCCNLAWQP